ncbi:MAG: efflux RND transporter periplasmic adaptor subunit [Marinifilaceae bacterium]
MKNILFILCYLPIVMMGCQSNTGQTNSHGHDHGDHDHSTHDEGGHDHATDHGETISITLWSESTELFVEYSPLVAGHTSTFTTHLTHLANYKPYEKGKLTVSLVKGRNGIRKAADVPSRSGIFTPSLQPKEAGIYTLSFDIESGDHKERFSIPNITVYRNDTEAQAANGHKEKPNLVSYTKEQAWKNEFATQLVGKKPFRDVIKTTGELISANQNEIKVVAQTNGIVQFQSNEIVAGKTVAKNQSLFNITGKGLSGDNLTQRYIAAKTDFVKAERNFTRAENLHADQIISEKDYLEVKTNYEQAKTTFDQLNRNYSSKGIQLKSPTKGFISSILVSQGEYVEKGQVLAIIDRNTKLVLRADVYQNQLPRISQIRSANFILPYSKRVYQTSELNGKLIAYGKDVQKSDYTSPLYFEINKTSELYSGTFVEIYLQSETHTDVVAVPKPAIMEDQGTKYVFVQEEGEAFVKRYVKTGSDNGLEVEVVEGLQKGERIVTKGAYFVRLASLGGALPAHSHSH